MRHAGELRPFRRGVLWQPAVPAPRPHVLPQPPALHRQARRHCAAGLALLVANRVYAPGAYQSMANLMYPRKLTGLTPLYIPGQNHSMSPWLHTECLAACLSVCGRVHAARELKRGGGAAARQDKWLGGKTVNNDVVYSAPTLMRVMKGAPYNSRGISSRVSIGSLTFSRVRPCPHTRGEAFVAHARPSTDGQQRCKSCESDASWR